MGTPCVVHVVALAVDRGEVSHAVPAELETATVGMLAVWRILAATVPTLTTDPANVA